MASGIAIVHLHEFVELWRMIQWKLTNNKTYTATSAYTAQFISCTKVSHINII